MNFDEIYEKIQTGTATKEEQEAFKKEIDEIRKISAVLSETPESSPVFQQADAETIRQAKKKHNRKTLIKTIAITIVSLLLIAAIVCGIIFIPSCTSAAKNQIVGREEAIELAKDCVVDLYKVNRDELTVRDVDKELDINGRLNNAVYIYEVKLRAKDGTKFEVEVSTKSGYAQLTDMDRHFD